METVIEWLPRIGALLTLLLGLVCFFRPQLVTDTMGIELTKPEAWSEIRTVFGGLMAGTSIGALYLNSTEVYLALGLGWLFALLARFYSIPKDGMTIKGLIPAFVIDGGLAFLFLSGCLL
ncbi:MAG: hypothetical protein OXC05_09620 [Halieaceae bacterium]|nr:hypothetical protein [Halieaceae bacterium]